MPFVIVGLLVIVLICGFSYPSVKKHLELKERETVVKGLLIDSNPQIRARAEAYVEREKLRRLGLAEAHQAAEILDTDEIKELIGGEFELQTVIEVLRSNQKSREDVKLLKDKN